MGRNRVGLTNRSLPCTGSLLLSESLSLLPRARRRRRLNGLIVFPSSGDLHCRRLHSISATALSVVPSLPYTIRVPAVLISCGPYLGKSCNRLICRHAGSLRSAAVLLRSPPTKLSKSDELLLFLGPWARPPRWVEASGFSGWLPFLRLVLCSAASRLAWEILIRGTGKLEWRLAENLAEPTEGLGTCVRECQTTGITGENIISHCQSKENDTSVGGSWYNQEQIYVQWKQLNCMTDCRYFCMMQREGERQSLGLSPVKYHGKWPFLRVSVFQEPLSAALSAINLLMHFTGWLSFFLLVNYKLPLRPQMKRTYYEYTVLWHIYAILSMNAWFWSSIFHTRDIDLTEKLDYSSAVALLGYSLILSLLRTFNVKDEATRVMFAAPVLAFVTTHILYLNFYELDYGWNMKVCVVMAVVQLLSWAIWGGVSRHPSRLKLWTVVFGGALAMLLELYDFPPYMGYADAHSLWHASTIPLTYLWWSFIKDDAEFRTSTLIKKAK